MPNAADQKFLDALDAFASAAAELDRAWRPSRDVHGYPLPRSFDEHVSEFLEWREAEHAALGSTRFKAKHEAERAQLGTERFDERFEDVEPKANRAAPGSDLFWPASEVKATDVWWLVLFDRKDRPYIVDIPFQSDHSADQAAAFVATGYGFKRSEIVPAANRSEASKRHTPGSALLRLPTYEHGEALWWLVSYDKNGRYYHFNMPFDTQEEALIAGRQIATGYGVTKIAAYEAMTLTAAKKLGRNGERPLEQLRRASK